MTPETLPEKLCIATDGACAGNPGRGGWGFVVANEYGEVIPGLTFSGGNMTTTNNRMELQAAIEALLWVDSTFADAEKKVEVSLLTDSQYVQKGITEWIHGWKKNSWIGSNKKPVKNQDLWRDLDALNSRLSVSWLWVKGHSGHPLNEIADKLANSQTGL